MVAWVPLAKALAPHVTAIVSAALPAFTTRKGETGEIPSGVIPQQIAELQAAVTRNDAHIRELAEQLQTAALAMEQAALEAQRRLHRLYLFSGVSLVIALVAVVVAILR